MQQEESETADEENEWNRVVFDALISGGPGPVRPRVVFEPWRWRLLWCRASDESDGLSQRRVVTHGKTDGTPRSHQ